MLEIKNITKIYKTEGFEQKALDNVSLNFRKCEFASILGPSGSGKTTFLNIIGGLDHYTNGDIIINEISTKKYKDADWDSYRNHRIGFIFQSYNLISHQNILSNVKLALTLSGISKKEATKRAKDALIQVGLRNHMYKKPNQLSGGQMQRVAIARALVNNPDILLADEPTGALDSETSVQIMELLKSISKDKLVIMVTHNPELANKYSTRIINLKDGKIVSDSNPYDGKINTKDSLEKKRIKESRTNMSFKTALGLSFNNLLTKKGRTILVSLAGSIGIIGIALILAVSTGFQNYVDSIQEETLTSYPLSIMQESTDIAGILLSMRSNNGEKNDSNIVKEQQYMLDTLSNIKANDLKSFKRYLDTNYNKVSNDLALVKYSYSIDPLIYTKDATGKLAKLNPSNLFTSFYSSNVASSFSTFASVYSEIIDNKKVLDEQYDVLMGRWPSKYDELVIVLSEPNTISDLLIYSLGLRDTTELEKMVESVMRGEEVNIKHEPLELSYEDLMNIELKLIEPSNTYKYNKKYKVYEDMSKDDEYMEVLYNKATKLHIVGIVSAKEGVTSTMLSPGINYTKDLVDHIIDYAENSDVVKAQLKDEKTDVFSNNKFDSKENKLNFGFSDLISIDSNKLKSAFNTKVDTKSLEKDMSKYISDINNSLSVDTSRAYKDFVSTYDELVDGLFKSTINIDNNDIVDKYMTLESTKNIIDKLETKYAIPSNVIKNAYTGLLKGLIEAYKSTTSIINNNTIKTVNDNYKKSAVVTMTLNKMASTMSETIMKRNVLTKVSELTKKLTSSMASGLKVDESKIASAFKLKFSEDELMRVVGAISSKSEANYKNNLIKLGYQDREEPTYISFYFNSFDGKNNFMNFIDEYNNSMKKQNEEDKTINYSDTTGILMNSVKTIVNAVSYVLIAFVSISLVVSSIMIGIITFISVYERTKEIGVLRSIGASKHNISSIFNAETFIIGLLSGLIGIGISYSLIPLINVILLHYTGNISLHVVLNPSSAMLLVILSIILTLIGGLIPAKKASKKDPVEALRSE